MAVLYTVGYQRTHLASLLAVLLEKGIEEVVDVRLTPISRKPGFSKTELAKALVAEGVAYSHRPELGCPKEIRTTYRGMGDFARYAHAYERQVLTGATGTLRRLAETATQRRICLLCFEEDASRCHRSLVAEAARRANGGAILVEDLRVPSSGRTSRPR